MVITKGYNNNNNNNNKYEYTDYSNYDWNNIKKQYKNGFNIASINARGLTSDEGKRLELLNWLTGTDTDVLCIQEWYIHNKNEEKKFNMASFDGYNIIQNKNNTKTCIIYKNILNIIKFNNLNLNVEENGLDISWIGIITEKFIIVVGSLYHSPSYNNINYDEITLHITKIKNKLKSQSKQIIFQINGDFNAKNNIWGSSKTNERGEYVLDWIGDNNLDFINDGSPTHYNKTNNIEDVLDLSLITTELKNHIDFWKVDKYYSREKSFSDHYFIKIRIKTDPICNYIPDKIKWNFKDSKIKEYRYWLSKTMKKWLKYYNKYKNDRNKINSLTQLFQFYITKAGRQSFGFRWYKKK